MNPYKSIRLTSEQKHKMAHTIHQPKRNNKKFTIRFIIYPAFIATALFLLFLLANGPSTQPINMNQASSEVVKSEQNWTHAIFTVRMIVQWTVSIVLLMATYVIILITAKNPENSIYFKSIRYVNQKMKNRKMLGIAIMPIVIVVCYTAIVLISPWPNLVLQAIILLLVTSLYFYLSVLWFRKAEMNHKCPHCQKALTNKEISWAKKCSNCANNFAVRAITTFQPVLISIILTPFVINKIEFEGYLIIGYFIIICLVTCKLTLRHLKIEQIKKS